MDDLVTASCVVPMATNPNHHCGWQLVTLCTDMLCVVLPNISTLVCSALTASEPQTVRSSNFNDGVTLAVDHLITCASLSSSCCTLFIPMEAVRVLNVSSGL